MTSRERLEDQEIQRRVAELGDWRAEDNRLRKTFTFRDFVDAFGWMTRVALVAEKIDHHPDWKNVYKTVNVELWTHDAGGLTELDFQLAQAMNRLAG